MTKSNFGGLSNKELIFINFIVTDILNAYKTTIEDKGVMNQLHLPDDSYIKTFKQLTDEDIDDIISSKRYKYLTSINEKLDSVVDLIKHSFPDTYNSIEDIFETFNDEEDLLS